MFTIEKKRDEDGMEGMQLKSWIVVSFFKVKDVEAEEVASIFHPILHKKKLEVRWGVLERDVMVGMGMGVSWADLLLSFGGECGW